MSTADPESSAEAAVPELPEANGGRAGRIRSLVAGTRDLARIAYRDPDHVSERLTLKLVERLGEPSAEWARAVGERPSPDVPAVVANLRRRSIQVARIDGAIAGTPFLIALIPGYLGFLYQEAAMVLRTAALYGRDPRSTQAAAEFLVLRGIHPTVEAAQAELKRARQTPMPGNVAQRRPVRDWVHTVRMLAVFGGFVSPPSDGGRPRGLRATLLAVVQIVIAAAVWVSTWVFPVTFMLAMSWGCESHTRALGRRTAALYAGEGEPASGRQVRADDRRRWLRTGALVLSLGVPIAFVVIADHVRNQTGVSGFGAVGGVVALSLVVAMAMIARRT